MKIIVIFTEEAYILNLDAMTYSVLAQNILHAMLREKKSGGFVNGYLLQNIIHQVVYSLYMKPQLIFTVA